MIEINKVYNCKNQEFIPQLPDKSVQVFLEDMPYGVTQCSWDQKPDLKEYWEIRLSKLKDNGCFVLFSIQPFTTDLINSNRKMFKYELIWDKKLITQPLLAKIKPMQKHENILIFYKKKVIYNPQKINKKSNDLLKRDKRRPGKFNHKSNHFKMIHNDRNKDNYKYPDSILIYTRPTGSNQFKKNKIIHSCQKPVKLMEYLIKTYSNENDLIFDGFSGSGTTAIACLGTNRNYICCESDKEYYDKSIQRINDFKGILFIEAEELSV